jgi:hypothetical protein
VRACSQQVNAEHDAVQRQSKLDGMQATIMAQLDKLSRREPTLEAERILMVNLATTRGKAHRVAPSPNCEGGSCQTEATAAMLLNALPPPSADGVDKLYHQLAEIDTIITTQLRSAPVGTGLTHPLARLMPEPVGKGPPWSPSWQGWHHHHRLTSHPSPHCGDRASTVMS